MDAPDTPPVFTHFSSKQFRVKIPKSNSCLHGQRVNEVLSNFYPNQLKALLGKTNKVGYTNPLGGLKLPIDFLPKPAQGCFG
jgi:hypothetical protein